ncbi:hypothetical protein [Herbidospora sp. RD11066]
MKTDQRPWHTALTENVWVLGEAARRLRAAQKAAEGMLWVNDEFRVQDLRGIAVRSGTRWADAEWQPHVSAVTIVADAFRAQRDKLESAAHDASVAYATGTVSSVISVLAGEERRIPIVLVDQDGKPLLHPLDVPAPDLVSPSGQRWSGEPKFRAAYDRLARMIGARHAAAELASESYLADHEAAEMHKFLDEARDLPDAAYDYGTHAENALRFALLPVTRFNAGADFKPQE